MTALRRIKMPKTRFWGPIHQHNCFLFLIKHSHMRTIKCCRFHFLGEVDNYCPKKTYSRRCQKPKIITHNITNCLYIVILVILLISGFCLFSPVSGSQYPNFFDPNLFLGQRKATTKKISLMSPASFEKFNQRQL